MMCATNFIFGANPSLATNIAQKWTKDNYSAQSLVPKHRAPSSAPRMSTPTLAPSQLPCHATLDSTQDATSTVASKLGARVISAKTCNSVSIVTVLSPILKGYLLGSILNFFQKKAKNKKKSGLAGGSPNEWTTVSGLRSNG